jgi:uncharacterized membrane protein
VGLNVPDEKPKQPQNKTLADRCSETIGSWTFIGVQTSFLAFWICLNIWAPRKPDPYPFVFLNLLLSFQAAYTGPVLLMAANRQSEIDRKRDIDHFMLDMRGNTLLKEVAREVKRIEDLLGEEEEGEEHW